MEAQKHAGDKHSYLNSKKFNSFLAIIIIIFSLQNSQALISQFDFNDTPLTTATVGPNASSINSNTTTDGTGIRVTSGFGGSTGLDIVVPNTGNVFDVNSIAMIFNFQRDEGDADFFERGDMRFYMQGGQLRIQYATSDGAGGSTTYGPTATGYTVTNDNTYRDYKFSYDNVTGVATISVNGTSVWTYDGPNNRDLYWTGAGDVDLGKSMDGNGSGQAYLNYVKISEDIALPITLTYFNASKDQEGVALSWGTASEINNNYFTIERSDDAVNFEALAIVEGAGNSNSELTYHYIDSRPILGSISYYRLKQTDYNGQFEYAEDILAIDFYKKNVEIFSVYPNPSTDLSKTYISLSGTGGAEEILVVVRDVRGKEYFSKIIKLKQSGETIEAIDINDKLTPGVYFITATSDDNLYNQKLIIN